MSWKKKFSLILSAIFVLWLCVEIPNLYRIIKARQAIDQWYRQGRQKGPFGLVDATKMHK